MEPGNIDFYYFSGTGNTLLAMKAMRDVFVRAGCAVQLYPIEKTNPGDLNLGNTIGLAFTVAAQSTYPMVWRFLERMPKTHDTRVFMVDTMGKFSGGIVGPLRRLLEAKGYQTIGAKEIIMPSNFLCKSIDENRNRAVIEKGLKTAEEFAKQLLRGEGRWGRIPVLSDVICAMSRSERSWKFIRNRLKLKVDTTKCTKCKLCVKLCPVENIEMKEYPEHGDHCEFCMRCFSFCQEEAIFLNQQGRYKPYHAVAAKELLAQTLQ